MACAVHPMEEAGRTAERVFPVIADGGEEVAVVLAPLPHPPQVGDCFEYHGITWVVVRAKDHLRGAVAVPAGQASR